MGPQIDYQSATPSVAHHRCMPTSDLEENNPSSFHLLLSSQLTTLFRDLGVQALGTSAENATAGHVGGLRVAFGLPEGRTGG